MKTAHKLVVILMVALLLAVPVLAACGDDDETPSPTLTPSPTTSPTVEPTPTAEPPTPEPTVEPTQQPTETSEPTPTILPGPTETPTIPGVDTVYLNGTVITMNPSNELAEAVAIEGDQITAVGTDDEIEALIGYDTTIVDLNGKTMLPGFIDPHSHFWMAGDLAMYTVDLTGPPVGTVDSVDDVIEKLKPQVASTPAGEWIVGSGYDDTLLEENRHPNRYDLDQVSTEHPIFIWHSSYHFAVVNSLGLELAGITKDSPQPKGGAIRMDADTGEPTGVLEEQSAYVPVYMQAMMRSPEERAAAVEAIAQRYASQGVTTAQEGAAHVIAVGALIDASERGFLPIRVLLLPLEQFADSITTGSAGENLQNAEMVSAGAAKLFSDGSIQGYTGYLTEPYYVPPGDDPEYCGYPTWDREELAARVTELHQQGYQIAIHANGDAAIDDILYAFSEAQEAYPTDDPRFICIHCQMAREDQLDSMKELGVIPSFFMLHTYYWGDRHRDIFMGPERASRMSPANSAIERGLLFTIHTDTPVVPMEPLRLVWSAVNRVSTSGEIIGEEQRITPLEALKAITTNAAYQYFEEDIKGSIEPGKLADLVILTDNPLDVDPMTIVDIEVEETIVGGATVFKKQK